MPKKIYENVLDAMVKELTGRPAGDHLPSEAALCQQFACSRQTLRKVLAELTARGLITSQQGSGSYVAKEIGGSRSREVALVVPSISRFIYSDIAGGVESVLSAAGHRLTLYQANGTMQRRGILRRLCSETVPDGLIILGMNESSTPLVDYFARLRAQRVPIIVSEGFYTNLTDVSVLSMDGFSAGIQAAELFTAAGRRKPVCIVPGNSSTHRLRAHGFLCGLDRAGLPVTDTSVFAYAYRQSDPGTADDFPSGDTVLANIYEEEDAAMREVLRTADGVFTGDLTIFYVLNVLRELGRTPGKDVSLLSITDSAKVRFSQTPISALAHPKALFGTAAAEMMLRLLAGGKNEQMVMPFTYIDRGSV